MSFAPDFSRHLPALRARFAAALRPRERVRFRDWVEARVVIPEGQPRPGPFRHTVPASLEIMDAYEDPEIDTICVRAPVQMMKTTILTNAVTFTATEDPCEMLVYEPDKEIAEAWLHKRLDPIATNIAEISAGFTGIAAKSMNRVFPGGDLAVKSGLQKNPEIALSARRIFIDEFRAFDQDLYQQIRGRGLQYLESGLKVLAASSAGDQNECATTALLEQSDWRVWDICCPACGTFEEAAWENLDWEERNPESAAYVCGACGERLDDELLQLANRHGRWRATRTAVVPGLAGFSCNFLANPVVPMVRAVSDWILANDHLKRTGSESRVRAFVRDMLARPYRPGSSLDPEVLNDKCRIVYPDGAAPEWVAAVTLCVDVQDWRLEYEFAGWTAVEVEAEQDAHRIRMDGRTKTFATQALAFAGRHYQLKRCGLEYGTIDGDTGQRAVWDEFDHLRCTRRFAVGSPDSPLVIRPVVAFVDSGGHSAEQVKSYLHSVRAEAASGTRRGCPVYPVKGASAAGQPLVRQSPNEATRVDWGGNFLLLGVDGAKDLAHAMLRQSRFALTDDKATVYPGPSHAEPPPRGYGLHYFEMLCSETKTYAIDRWGKRVVAWIKDEAVDNEALDLFAYSLSAIKWVGLGNVLAYQRRAAKILEPAAADD